MPSLTIRPFTRGDTEAAIRLWELCDLTRPRNDPLKDIQRKLAYQPELFIAGTINDQLISTAMAGYDGHRGSVYYLAVHPDHQTQGIGRLLMSHVENSLSGLGCPKLNILIRASNISVQNFYEQQSYTKDEATCLGKRLI